MTTSTIDELVRTHVARFTDRIADWDAFADARVDGYRNEGQRRWRYALDAGQIADLQARYGAGDEMSAKDPGTDPAKPVAAPESGAIR